MQTNRFFRRSIFLALAFMALLPAARAADDFAKDFENANHFYDQGKFEEAKRLYDSAVSNGHYSPELFYNLGNTEFRLDKTGAAILNYERALSLSPGNAEIEANLAYVRAQTGAEAARKDWRDDIVMNFGVNSYCWLAAIAAWCGIFALAVMFLKMRPSRTVPTLAALCSAAVLGYAVFAIWHLEKNDALAIIMAKSAEARSAPADNSPLAATLPEGSRVWILERRGPWVHCRLPGKDTAWIPADAIERVRLQNS